MANEFKVRKGLIVSGSTETEGDVTVNGNLQVKDDLDNVILNVTSSNTGNDVGINVENTEANLDVSGSVKLRDLEEETFTRVMVINSVGDVGYKDESDIQGNPTLQLVTDNGPSTTNAITASNLRLNSLAEEASYDRVVVADSSGNFAYTSSAAFSTTPSTQNLQQVLDEGNTATENITLTGELSVQQGVIRLDDGSFFQAEVTGSAGTINASTVKVLPGGGFPTTEILTNFFDGALKTAQITTAVTGSDAGIKLSTAGSEVDIIISASEANVILEGPSDAPNLTTADEVILRDSTTGVLYVTASSLFTGSTAAAPNDSLVTLTAGSGLTGGGTFTLDQATDETIVFDLETGVVSGSSQIDHDLTTNFVADEHIDHSSVNITAGDGLSGGGDITATRTLTLDTGSSHFVNAVTALGGGGGSVGTLQQVTDNGSTTDNIIILSSSAPFLDFTETSAAANNGRLRVGMEGDEFWFQPLTDAGAGSGDYFAITRTDQNATSLAARDNGTTRAAILNAGRLEAYSSTGTITSSMNENGLDLGENTSGFVSIDMGRNRTADGAVQINMFGQTTDTNYGIRIVRDASGISSINHSGSNTFQLVADHDAPINFRTNSTLRGSFQANGVFSVDTDTLYVDPSTDRVSINNFGVAAASLDVRNANSAGVVAEFKTAANAIDETAYIHFQSRAYFGYSGSNDSAIGSNAIVAGRSAKGVKLIADLGNNSYEAFFGQGDGDVSIADSNIFYKYNTKRLGINDNTPSYTLDVKNSVGEGSVMALGLGQSGPHGILFGDESSTTGGMAMLYRTTANSISIEDNSDPNTGAILAEFNQTGDFLVDTDTLFVDASEDRVGINTSSPENSLHILSSVIGNDPVILAKFENLAAGSKLGNGAGAGIEIKSSAVSFKMFTGIESAFAADENFLKFERNTAGTIEEMFIFDNTNVSRKSFRIDGALGVDTSQSATAGTILASNDIVAFASSDKRWKDNINKIPNALNKVMNMSGVSFDWVVDENAHPNKGSDIGIIAQEVQTALEGYTENVVDVREDTGMLAVRYERLIPVLIEAIKEQQDQIEELKKLIK